MSEISGVKHIATHKSRENEFAAFWGNTLKLYSTHSHPIIDASLINVWWLS